MKRDWTAILWGLALAFSAVGAVAQKAPVIVPSAELARVVPSSFYFEGQTGPTQMRNAAAARFGQRQHVIAALVDTSGYSADVRAKYEGFLITDIGITINDQRLDVGAYGFGFTEDGRFNLFDVSGRQLLSVAAAEDTGLRRPRPLMMVAVADGVRLYSGRHYVRIKAR
ncbi:hypothetical protein [Pyrinomonas sp.]|uniref:hypothetical protein n=1 Tax=Pyrinomonas sp. TaxID=2080306 RepID=UPI00332FF5CB